MPDIAHRLRTSIVLLDAEREEAAAEIERLRKLLGQTFTMWMNDADPAELPELVERVREALGDEGAA